MTRPPYELALLHGGRWWWRCVGCCARGAGTAATANDAIAAAEAHYATHHAGDTP